MLDELKTAVFLLNRTGQITHTNESGRDILGRKDFLYAERGRLLAADPKLNRNTLRRDRGIGLWRTPPRRAESIALPFVGRDGQRFVGHVLPLTSGRRRENRHGLRCNRGPVRQSRPRSMRRRRGPDQEESSS
jgi:hypothetical protein